MKLELLTYEKEKVNLTYDRYYAIINAVNFKKGGVSK